MNMLHSPPEEKKLTPMMAQWQACKDAAGDALLLFRMGDFYEAFEEDAAIIAKELSLTLTSRQGTPMSGIPHHTSESYIDKLVNKGFRVAVAEQTSDPKASKGLVTREVVRVVSPGTLMNSSLLQEHANNYFAAITRVGKMLGLAVIDLSTADFRVTEFEEERELLNELCRLQPAELLTSHRLHSKHTALFEEARHAFEFLLNGEEEWRFEHQVAYNFLLNHFRVQTLDGFGVQGMTAGINAAGALLNFLSETLSLPVDHISNFYTYSTKQFLDLDRMTQKNLELTQSLNDGSRRHTLLGIIDQTKTAMGARLLHRWVKQPLIDVEAITARHDAVAAYLSQVDALDRLRALLDNVKDIERLMMKIQAKYASPRDVTTLRFSLEPLHVVKETLLQIAVFSPLLTSLANQIQLFPTLTQLIARALTDEAPARLTDGKVIRDGFHSELDELRAITRDSKTWLAQYQVRLREETDIKTLKVGFNKMSGYYIEVSKGQTSRVPDTFVRRQTLTNAERYLTPELKEYEQKVLTAEEKMGALEAELFYAIRDEVAKYAKEIVETARAIAQMDCLQSFAQAARQYNYTRPRVDESQTLTIVDGRHPVIERVHMAERFIPNDTALNNKESKLWVITGPNMAGKSTYIRQVALIVILAQMGAYVPAKEAHIGAIDKVFTRIGASDDLSRGHSTFMVEMTETANILHHATSRSLVILDEIGRGTSTYDGISIAWSVAEFLLTNDEGKQAKTLFATHYAELMKLEEEVPGALNYNIAVNESNGEVTYLRKIVRGGTDKSYGIHVGRLAGLPSSVIERAQEILVHLEENGNRKETFKPAKRKKKQKKGGPEHYQLTFFG